MTRRLAFLLLLAPGLALAQSNPGAGKASVVESADSNENPPYVNILECNGTTTDKFTFYWNATSGASGGTYDVYISNTNSSSSACPPSSSTSGVVNQQIVPGLAATGAAQSYTDTISVAQRLSQIGIACDSSETLFYICVNYNPPSAAQVINAASGTANLDLVKPTAPAQPGITPGDTVLHVTWEKPSGTTVSGYRVYVALAGGTLALAKEVTGSATTSADIEGLTNDTAYDVAVTSLSLGKNESDRSPVATAAPQFIYDFWRYYQYKGGPEQGGCAGGEAGLIALLALAPLALRRRQGRNP